MTERETTYQERATWGVCPTCKAKHGEKCDASVGLSLGLTFSGAPPKDGVHLGRLKAAPLRVKLVEVG